MGERHFQNAKCCRYPDEVIQSGHFATTYSRITTAARVASQQDCCISRQSEALLFSQPAGQPLRGTVTGMRLAWYRLTGPEALDTEKENPRRVHLPKEAVAHSVETESWQVWEIVHC